MTVGIPRTMETLVLWGRFEVILKAGTREFGELTVWGRKWWMPGRLRSYVQL